MGFSKLLGLRKKSKSREQDPESVTTAQSGRTATAQNPLSVGSSGKLEPHQNSGSRRKGGSHGGDFDPNQQSKSAPTDKDHGGDFDPNQSGTDHPSS